MKIHEYQAMELFRQYGINAVPCYLASDPDDAASIAEKLGSRVVCKAQVLLGGRGKAGGVKLADSPSKAAEETTKILSMTIKSLPVKKVLVAKAVNIAEEYYLGITIDRAAKRITLIATSSGGVEIEELAKEKPDLVQKMYVEPFKTPGALELEKMLGFIFGADKGTVEKAKHTMLNLYKLFVDKDCSLVEINPFVKTKSGELLAVDAKINFDDNAVFKHPEIAGLLNPEEYSGDERLAREAGLSFVSMDGNIGCIVNGAGLAMATMDVIKLFGGEAANFLDVGGSSNPKKVLNALKIILTNKSVKAILINIFGGITRCDDIAKGIVMAAKELDIKVPLVIRLIGTNESEGRKILEREGFVVAEEMTEAVRKVVENAKKI